MAGRVMNHTRDEVYRTVAHPTMAAADKAAMLKRLADADAQAQTLTNTNVMPPLGGVAETHLRPDIAPKVPAGAARPYAPGEYTDNPDRSWSSERSMTVQKPDGSWSVLPSLWLQGGKPHEAASEDEAIRLAQASKLPFRKFASLKEADKFATDREAAWQPIQNPADADKIPPLWAPGSPAPNPAAAPPALTPANIATAASQTIGALGAAPGMQSPQSVASFGAVAPPPTAAFGALPANPFEQPNPFAAAGPGNEIDRQRRLALAALGQPPTYPTLP